MPNLTHFDEHGAAVMVDVSGKETTHREALATGIIRVSEAVYAAIEGGTAAKGDVLGIGHDISMGDDQHRRRDGSPARRQRRAADRLRHVQGDRQAHGDHGHSPRAQVRRQERHIHPLTTVPTGNSEQDGSTARLRAPA